MSSNNDAHPISRIAAGASDSALMLIVAIPLAAGSIDYAVVWIFLFAAAYLFAARAYFDQTLGEAVVGIRVVQTNGQPINQTIAAMRSALSFFVPVVLGLMTSLSTDALQARIGTAISGFIQAATLALVFAYYAGNWIAIFMPARMNIYDYCTNTNFIQKPGLFGKTSDPVLTAIVVIAVSVGIAFGSLFVLAVSSARWG